METKQKSELIYQGRNINIYRDIVECENHLIATRDCVRAKGGVGILAIQNSQILLVKQFRYLVNQDLYEIPAGTKEIGEEPIITARRELEEETHYLCDSLTLVNQMYSTPGFCDEVIHIYQAHHLKKTDKPLSMDEDEQIEAIWMDLDKAYEMIQTRQIMDAKTILAIQYAKLNGLK